MPNPDPVAAGKKGGASRSEAKLAAARKNGFQKVRKPQESTIPEQIATEPTEE